MDRSLRVVATTPTPHPVWSVEVLDCDSVKPAEPSRIPANPHGSVPVSAKSAPAAGLGAVSGPSSTSASAHTATLSTSPDMVVLPLGSMDGWPAVHARRRHGDERVSE